MNRRVIIIGAGLGGIGLGIQLNKLGVDFTILERADAIGGVWRDNDYPGAACDIPAVLYSFTFEQKPDWSCAYPPQAEILQYINDIAAKHDVTSRVHLNTTVVSADWQEDRNLWVVKTADGRVFEGEILVPAVGIFGQPTVPTFKGQDVFAGEAFHSTNWRHEIDYAGKRIGVIGTGASAVQIVPQLIAKGAKVVLFQRTAAYVQPKSMIDTNDLEGERTRIFNEFEWLAKRRSDMPALEAARKVFLEMLEKAVPDPVLRAKLTPNFTLGCKRTAFSNEWYPALQHENCHVETLAIDRFETSGICVSDGTLHELDAVVYATGFNTADYLPGIAVNGRDGVSIHDTWSEGAEAYLGMCVSGFPNMFMLYGPNTNAPGTIIFAHECQFHYLIEAMKELDARDARWMDVRPEVMRAYCDEIQREIEKTSHASSHCDSYYLNAAGRVVTNYPGPQSQYKEETSRVVPEHFLMG